jgi:IS1 family transposase
MNEIGEGIETAIRLYDQVKARKAEIVALCTDGNSCYKEAFKRHGVSEPHFITKAETHRMESFNSSIRDNLVRFTRRTKRFSKTMEMLRCVLDLFFAYKRGQAQCYV